MLFHVRMDVAIPRDLDPAERARPAGSTRRRAPSCSRRSGTWVHLWRVVGQHAATSASSTSTAGDELHEILWSLPLFPFMTVAVTPLAEHPSALSANP